MSIAISTAIGLVYPGFYAPPPEPPWVGPPVHLLPQVLPTLYPGVPYSAALVSEGGKTPYRYGLIAGVLPPGISMTTNGIFSGTAPNVAVMMPTTLPPALVDQFYSQPVTVADAIYPFTVRVVDAVGQIDEEPFVLALWENPTAFGLASGAVPGCMSFAGGLTGPPLKVGTFPITVHATDIRGRTISQNYILTVLS